MSTATPVPFSSPLPSSLSGTTTIVVGGTSGVGLAVGELLRSVGGRVVLIGRDPERLNAAVARLRSAAPSDDPDAVMGVAGDGADEKVLVEAFDRVKNVDHVVVTAGDTSGMGLLANVSTDELRSAFEARVPAAFTAARVAATRLPAGGSLTFSSGTVLVKPYPGAAAGLAAAGAVEALTKAVGVELAPARIRVNCVRFGRTDTPLLRSTPGLDSDEAVAAAGASWPLGRFGTAEEGAAGVLFVMANNYMTGQIVTIDGGETMA
ncbi:SDR family oxidoreductase [Kitasatospora sp. NPDC018619]|uniref:SDR family oxidoreductase n=1 Tax=unclassified Kitasatospora TaxID=2633591 RepID=UPI003787EDBB